MSEQTAIPDYADCALILNEPQTNQNPSQVHGLICGFICGRRDENTIDLNKFFPTLHDNQACREIIQTLYAASFGQLNQFSFEFELLLPDDDTEINVRSEALGLWCQGFITALQQENPDIEKLPKGELSEALDDLLEIAQVSFGDIEDDDENEAAYFELIEYVRLSVLMIYQELHPNAVADGGDDQ